ncbi:MAG: phosphatidate cytidylyltransferase [Ignavibacteriaceae bacterium]|nr:phosphatidate cytidylyltransferase [Ignavibacteriaceae bacterium]
MQMSNGLIRVLVSIAAIPVILLASYLGTYYFLLFVLMISLVSYYEFAALAKQKSVSANLMAGLGIIFLFVTNAYIQLFNQFYLISIAFALLCLIELFRNKGSALFNLGISTLGILYIGVFSSSLILIREFYREPSQNYINGGFIIISVFAAIWICDSAAYYIGTAFGKHKLFPRVSPKKSWEGAAAGFVSAILFLILAKFIFLDFLTWYTIFGAGIIVGILGQIGDLIESLFKRDAGVKDSSSLIPGHGGVFDRFDSLIYSAPFILILLQLIEK